MITMIFYRSFMLTYFYKMIQEPTDEMMRLVEDDEY
jgi:hypothetical protein